MVYINLSKKGLYSPPFLTLGETPDLSTGKDLNHYKQTTHLIKLASKL